MILNLSIITRSAVVRRAARVFAVSTHCRRERGQRGRRGACRAGQPGWRGRRLWSRVTLSPTQMRNMNEGWLWSYRRRHCRMQRRGRQRGGAVGPSRGGLNVNGLRGKRKSLRKCGVGYRGECGAVAKSVQAGSSGEGMGGVKVKHIWIQTELTSFFSL